MREVEARDVKLLEKSSLSIKLVPENEKDIKLARLLRLQASESVEEGKKRKRKEILSEPVFPRLSSTITSEPNLEKKNLEKKNLEKKNPALDHLVRTLRQSRGSRMSNLRKRDSLGLRIREKDK